jgi:hypothetical protein
MTSKGSRSQRPTRRAWGAVLPVLLAGAAALAALIAFVGLASDSRGHIARIAEDPWAFDGRRVTLRGIVAEAPGALPRGDAFVLAGSAGDRLLVLPAGEAGPLVPAGRVEVTGVIRAPAREADERRPEPPPVTLTDLLSRTRSRAFIDEARVLPVETSSRASGRTQSRPPNGSCGLTRTGQRPCRTAKRVGSPAIAADIGRRAEPPSASSAWPAAVAASVSS